MGRWGARVVLAVAVLGLMPGAAAAQTESVTIPASELIFITSAEADCVGEELTIVGNVHATFRDGELSHANLRGVYAIGATTGDRYRIVGSLKGDFSVLTFNIVGGGPGHRVREHVVITPSGVVHDQREFVCF